MNSEQIGGIIRHVLTFVGGIVVSNGYVDEQTMLTVVGAVATIVGAVWSWVAKKPA